MVHSFAKVLVTFSLTTYESVPYLSIFTKNCTRVFDTDKTTFGPFFFVNNYACLFEKMPTFD